MSTCLKMSRKHIRKQSLVSQIQSFPFDLYLYLHELHASIDWDQYNYIIALPLGIISITIFSIIQSILNYYHYINKRSQNILFDSNYIQYEKLKNNIIYNSSKQPQERTTSSIGDKEIVDVPFTTTVLWVLKSINWLIIFIGLFNAAKLFTKRKSYGLLYCKLKPKSKNVFKSSIERLSFIIEILAFLLKFFQNEQELEEEQELNSFNESSIIMDSTNELIDDNEIWHLNVWDPSKFSLYLFIGLNPINLYIIYYLIGENNSNTSFTDDSNYNFIYPSYFYLNILILICLIMIIFYKFIEFFLQLINDKQILYQEMFQEYNKKFVNPKINQLKKDAMIDATLGPHYLISLNDQKPYSFSKLKVFIIHDIKGKPITEYGDIDSQILPQQLELEPLTSSCSTAINLRLTSRANSVAHYSNNNNNDNYINDDYDRTFNTSSNWNQNRRYQQSSRYHSGRNNDNLIMNTPLTYLPQPSRYSTQTPSLNSNLSFNRYDRTPSPTRGTTMSRRYSNPNINNNNNNNNSLHSPSRIRSRPTSPNKLLSPTRQPRLEFDGIGNTTITNDDQDRDRFSPFKSPSPIHRGTYHHSSPNTVNPQQLHQQQQQLSQQQQSSQHNNSFGYPNYPYRSPSPTRRRPSDSPERPKPGWR